MPSLLKTAYILLPFMARKIHNYNFYSHFARFVPGVADLVKLSLWFLAGVLLGNLVSTGIVAFVGAELSVEYVMLVTYPLMFIPAMIYAGVRSSVSPLSSEAIPLDRNGFINGPLAAAVSVAAVFAAAFCTDAVNSLLPPMPEYLKSILEGMTSGKLWVNLLCVSIFAPFFEEWLCRGMVLRGLLGRGVCPLWAIVVSALFFALIHANPWQAIPAFSLGLLFGYVYYRTGSLKLTMLMHFFNNTVAVLMTRIDGLEEAESWMDVLPLQAYWICFAACLIVVALSVRWFSRNGRS